MSRNNAPVIPEQLRTEARRVAVEWVQHRSPGGDREPLDDVLLRFAQFVRAETLREAAGYMHAWELGLGLLADDQMVP